MARSEVPCLYLVEGYDDDAKLLEVAERFELEGIVSKRKAAPSSGEDRNWVMVKTVGWRAANRERWAVVRARQLMRCG
jgi:ATP-dependent DNA ligase